ncbi:hypothetical protein GF312_07455 [Candidatus Poribacteria bacterium]|nr:hypothetical protein [Candidatus Poribacteria bacterium]
MVDENNDGTVDKAVESSGQPAYSLETGWNLVSFPLSPLNPDPNVVLSSIDTEYDSVWTYDPVAGWSVYMPDGTGNLDKIEQNRGYWIEMNQPGNLIIQRTESDPESILLKGEWNLIGFSSPEPLPIGSVVDPMPDGTCIYTYITEEGK